MRVVLDSCVIVAALLEEESTLLTEKQILRLQSQVLVVPDLWGHEVANALLVAVRRKRLSFADALERVQRLNQWEVEICPTGASVYAMEQLLSVADDYSISTYAAYVNLAIAHKAALATLDNRLSRAVAHGGIPLFFPLT